MSSLKAEVLNPFVLTSLTYLDMRLLMDVKKGPPALCKEFPPFSSGVMVRVGLKGDVNGTYTLAMDQQAALKVAGAMLLGLNIHRLDVMAQSALLEITQVMAASAALNLSRQGYGCAVTPPVLFTLPLRQAAPAVPTLTVPVISSHGTILLGMNFSVSAPSLTGDALAAAQ